MEDKECVPELAIQYYSSYYAGNYEIMSPEYVNEIVEEVLDDENHTKNSFTKSSRSSSEIVNVVEVNDEVYVAVGKDDLDVVRWAIDHVVSPGARLYLVHVFPPITHIPTPGKFIAKLVDFSCQLCTLYECFLALACSSV